MKKVLYGTTALLAAGVISTAVNAAEPLKLELGGYMEWYVASMKQDDDFKKAMSNAAAGDGDYNSFDVLGDGEVYFNGNTTLDNGVKVGVRVELEATGDRGIDESYATVDTAYGRMFLGSTRNVAAKMHVSAPEVGALGVEESEINRLVVAPAAVRRLDATWMNYDLKVNKVSYISPTLYGVTLGASWVPGAQQAWDPTVAAAGRDRHSDRSIAQTENFKDGYVLSMLYSEEFAGVGVALSGAYGNYSVGGNNNRGEYTSGLNLSYAGFTFGGAYRMVNDHTDGLGRGWNGANRMEGTASDDGYAWNIGAGYEAGPYGVSFNYMKSEVEGTRPTRAQRAANAAVAGTDEAENYMLSGKYNLGAGVDTFATVGYVEYSDELAKATNPANHNEGWAFATGLALSF